MTLKHSEVAKRFALRQTNTQGEISWSGKNVFCNTNFIFSYGFHFPMAKYLGEHPKYGHFFLKNSDKYSSSTSSHQSSVDKYCCGPKVSRHRLNGIDIETDFAEIVLKNIYLWRPGYRKFLYLDEKTNIYYSDYICSGKIEDSSYEVLFTEVFKRPRQGKFVKGRKRLYYRYLTGVFEIEEVLVLSIREQFFLFVRDHCVELPYKPKTIAEALKLGRKERANLVGIT